MTKEQRFFWMKAIPMAYPMLRRYPQDVVKWDRKVFRSRAQDKSPFLWIVGPWGSHIISKNTVTSSSYPEQFLRSAINCVGLFDECAVFLAEPKRWAIKRLAWENGETLYQEWRTQYASLRFMP